MFRAVLIIALLWFGAPSMAQTLSAAARVLPEGSVLEGNRSATELRLTLSQAVPFRVFTLTDPMRVVLDFRTVDFSALPAAFGNAPDVVGVQMGGASTPGWSRMILTLGAPLSLDVAAMETDTITGEAVVSLTLSPIDADMFAQAAGAPPGLDAMLLPTVTQALPTEDDTFVVMLDPGHGGIDPGALREGFSEAELILTFARELREVMRRTGQIEVQMTRDADIFVPLPTRVTLARAVGADLFISLHADAIAEGRAQGATVYTLSDEATDAATAALAEQHDRADLLQGIDLSGSDDEVVGVLLDLARIETAPRSRAFADTLVQAIDMAGLDLHARPRGEGAFSVLKAADFPAVLLEIGFLSEGGDLENIQNPEWRAQMQAAITDAVLSWSQDDAAAAALRRQ
ncbi:N-acetylmuramoyl-L-alanine amidase [Jannaschia sp. CCS1]|uniref:N-acetylmuramoyl-L-alanine amidase n=1 Tax=Jannaschia sp. (strain CCS1) TaxID=290400 RepID=UPI000053C869|nr:N-acetylmuramoyl-L-alanine amidase [Jannaschia sp. CCS1]ABD55453.1 N-acetylmuramoyl-L-alanine amidase [Jannaschia sp. CCS1]